MAQKTEEEEAQALKEQKERDEAERKYLEEAEAERLREEAELRALWEKQQEDHQNLDIASKRSLIDDLRAGVFKESPTRNIT